jgi:WD40 repeat protein
MPPVISFPKQHWFALARDGSAVLVGNGRIVELVSGSVVARCSPLVKERLWFAFSPAMDSVAITASTMSNTLLYAAADGRKVGHLSLGDDLASGGVSYCPTGDLVFAAGGSSVGAWDARTGRRVSLRRGVDDVSRSLVVTEDRVVVQQRLPGDTFVLVAFDRELRREVWRSAPGDGVQFLPAGDAVATFGEGSS